MNEYSQAVPGADAAVRRYEYEDESVVVADFGRVEGSVDLVDGTAIVVVDDEQHEFEVPAGAARALMNNGVVTIEVEDTR
jgi:hypothetical protein